jgi:leucyl aminopeptidase
MHMRLTDTPPRVAAATRVLFLYEARDPAAHSPKAWTGAVRAAIRASGFRGKDKELVAAGPPGKSFLLCGLGKAPASATRWRGAIRRAVRQALERPGRPLVLAFGAGIGEDAFRAILPQIALADYAFDRYKSASSPRRDAGRVFVVPPPGMPARGFEDSLREAEAIAEAVRWARDVGNTPANDLGPAELAAEAKALCQKHRLTFRALDRKEIAREKMGGVLGVNAGSVRPPVFLIGEHAPAKPRGTAVLVGKGITFDTGGISLKPAPSMSEMKYDMMGAATVFACLAAVKAVGLPVRVVALAPVTENMPGGSAQRPGDILRMRNGKTVEVDNTDAEGRLILGDALSYAEKYSPDVLLDYATLTGAVLIALGHECAGVMTEETELARAIEAAGEATGERVWRLPLWPEYRENLKSEWADMKNTGGRAAGTINAGVFLKEFVPDGVSWAHLDIAGVAHFEKEQSGWPPGASGFGVALTLEFLKKRFGV